MMCFYPLTTLPTPNVLIFPHQPRVLKPSGHQLGAHRFNLILTLPGVTADLTG